jgi:predicted RNase H-like HicB family nuclease
LELPGAIADGATPEEALANLKLVIDDWLEVAKEQKRPIPKHELPILQ